MFKTIVVAVDGSDHALKAVSIAADLELEGVAVRFDQLIPELQAGGFDVMAAGMFVTPQRCQEVAFSNPTYVVGQFRREDRELVEAFNRRLAEFIGSEAHRTLVEPYGFTDNMVPERTAAQLCQS